MSTTVKHFHSAMSGAPVLSGTAGSLIAVLDACLVNGFGLKTADSVVVSGGVATATFSTGHSFKPDVIALVSGATPAGLNGEKRVLTTSATAITFDAAGIADGAATGAITAKVAAAGWEKAYSGTNLGVYRSLSPQALGGGLYLRVNDNFAQSARVVGYESMSDADTGSGAFPTQVQMPGGGYWVKSDAESGAAVPYLLVSDGRAFYLHVQAGKVTAASANGGVTRGFGDLVPRRPSGDAYAVFLNFSGLNNAAVQHYAGVDNPRDALSTATPREYTGLSTAVLRRIRPYCGSGDQPISGADLTLGSFPSNVSGELFLSRLYLPDSAGSPRADFPGVVYNPQSNSGANIFLFDKVPGTGDFAGRTLVCVNPSTSPSNVGWSASAALALFDITGPWR